MSNTNKCENCGNDHNGEYGSGRFCTSKCARGFSTKAKRSLINEKVSKKLKGRESKLKGIPKSKNSPLRFRCNIKRNCLKCKKEYIAKITTQSYCSKYCARRSPLSDETKEKIRNKKLEAVKNGTHKGWQSRKIRSYAENFFKKVLINNNINFIEEYKINKRDLGFDNSANYFLDFYLPDYNLDLEIDGKQHEYPERKKSDKIRDKAIKKYGMGVYRIKWKNPHKNKQYIKNEIDKLMSFLKI